MNTATTNKAIQRKLSHVKGFGKNVPTSKSDLIRRLAEKKMTTGQIREKLQEAGFKAHYSEIYGAQKRATA